MKCWNKKVLIGLGAIALSVLAISPRQAGSVAPLLMFAVCPLSMIFMMRSMSGRGASEGNNVGNVAASSDAQSLTAVNSSNATSPRMRELEEEVNRLKAELHIRDQQPSN